MDFLSNTEWQFIISACISIISISVGIWLGYRRLVQIPISYEALAIEPADGSNADLSGASFANADLSEANLSGANLSSVPHPQGHTSSCLLCVPPLEHEGADLSEADLSGADLHGAQVTTEQLAQAKSLNGATLPDGSIHP